MSEIRENKMGTAPVFKLIMTMALPAIFSMLVQSLYNVVDSIFVAKLSKDALTAVSVAYPMQMLIIAFAVGTGVGVNSLMSRRLGEKKNDEASSVAAHGIVLSIITWALFAIAGIFFSESFIAMSAGNESNAPDIIRMGTEYLSIVQIVSIFCFFVCVAEKTVQATGNMIYPMICQLIGAVVNIIFDPICIFLLDMGVRGAAVATVFGQFCSFVYVLYIYKYKTFNVKITLKKFRFKLNIIKEIYVVGLPAILMQSIASVLTTCLNMILAALSTTAVAVLGIYFKLQSFVFMPVFGLNQGLMPVMGYNYGACNKKRLLDAYKYGCLIALVIMGAGVLIFMLCPGLLMQVFDADEEMMRMGVSAMRILSLSFLPAALGIISSTLFQATGKGMYSLIVSALRQLVVILPAAYAFAAIYKDPNMVWWAYPISEIAALTVCAVLVIRLYKKNIRHLDEQRRV